MSFLCDGLGWPLLEAPNFLTARGTSSHKLLQNTTSEVFKLEQDPQSIHILILASTKTFFLSMSGHCVQLAVDPQI